MNKELIKDAIQCFGNVIVNEVSSVIYISDADCAYSTFQDMGMDQHAECVEMLFFE